MERQVVHKADTRSGRNVRILFEDLSERSFVDVLQKWPDYLLLTCFNCYCCSEVANAETKTEVLLCFYSFFAKGSLPWLAEQEIKVGEHLCFSKKQVSNQVKK